MGIIPHCIRQQADLLYDEADRAVLASIIVMGLLGVLVGAAYFYFLAEGSEVLSIVLALGVPIAAAVIGAALGQGRAFKLRSQAQQLLVLVAIERNTRKEVIPQQHTGRKGRGPGALPGIRRKKPRRHHDGEAFLFHKSGRLDLNQRPPAPEAGALPGYATPRIRLDTPRPEGR